VKLSDRKKAILSAVVETYIQTGEPVGSKLLASRLGFKVSPATIRSDMAWLFDMGYLEQPHTSAGRVPSHLGYREYIDSLMRPAALTRAEKDEIDSLFNVKNPDPDKLLEDAAGALSDYTGCASVTSSITPKTVRIRRLELIHAAPRTVVILLIASNGVIRNKVLRVDFDVNDKILEFFDKFANSRLAGLSIEAISSSYINSVSTTLGEYARIFNPILAAIYELCKDISDGQYYLSGSVKLLEYDELSRLSRDMLQMLERRDSLQELFSPGSRDLRIIIGKENHSMELADASVVMTNYSVGGEPAGTVGLIGPVRIDYARLIPHLAYFARTLGDLLTDTLVGE
jgi:heat-inducible transcriptional repressor